MAREQRLSDAVYTGITEDGAEMRLSAETLSPDPDSPGLFHGDTLLARIIQSTGYRIDVMAAQGTLDDRNHRADLFGGVRIETGDGYVITAPDAWLRTNLSYLEGDGPIRAEGPLGQLTAGGLTISAEEDSGANTVALFHSGVKLVYLPQETGTP